MLRYILPLSLFIALIIFLGIGLTRDPRLVPSPLIGKPVPEFALPRLQSADMEFNVNDLKGQVSLLNVWASWCASCRIEHPLLVEVARENILPIYGLNYKDTREDALAWLERFGNPYTASAFDEHGRVAIDLGVYGAPETYIIDRNGIIAYKHIGPISNKDWETKLQPLILSLQEQDS